MLNIKLFVFLLCAVNYSLADNLNSKYYCANQKRLCGDKPHVACTKEKGIMKSCPKGSSIVPMTKELQDFILGLHNEARNNVALGKLESFEPASQMTAMVWSKELADLAETNARSCIYKHDECRNTDNFPFAGQNIAKMTSKPDYMPLQPTLRQLFNGWFNEYKFANMGFINQMMRGRPGPDTGHFTQLVGDRANSVGCSVTMYSNNDGKNVQFVCNYALTNMDKEPIYKIGKPCSACLNGVCMSNYGGLCDPMTNIHVVKALPYNLY